MQINCKILQTLKIKKKPISITHISNMNGIALGQSFHQQQAG
jgi:hypothetical protein